MYINIRNILFVMYNRPDLDCNMYGHDPTVSLFECVSSHSLASPE
ncbi:MAG: hypothetical protein ACI8Y7_001176 [Candidatus Woesearchaeota archaeon]|jgi:hypothetical protein